jgi:integrase
MFHELPPLRTESGIKDTDPFLYTDNGLVFCTSVGTPLIPRNLKRTFYRLVENAEVKRIRFHDLRHSHATILLKENVNPKIVVERLGWANINMMDRYAHVHPNMQRDTANNFGKIFFAKKKAQ